MAGASKQVTEYALSRILPNGDRQGLFSHERRELVESVRAHYAMNGVTETVIAKRECEYPILASGALDQARSTVNETEL